MPMLQRSMDRPSETLADAVGVLGLRGAARVAGVSHTVFARWLVKLPKWRRADAAAVIRAARRDQAKERKAA